MVPPAVVMTFGKSRLEEVLQKVEWQFVQTRADVGKLVRLTVRMCLCVCGVVDMCVVCVVL